MYKSLLFLLQKREDALNHPSGWDWVKNDPVVNFTSPTLHFLEKEGYLRLSKDLRRHSEALYWNLTAFWIRREQHLKPILQSLDEEEIRVIPLKGAGLLDSLYKQIGVRYMGDVDLLVEDTDFIKSSQILMDQGLQPKWCTDPNKLFDFVQLPQDFWPGELGFAGSENFHIDLHRDLITYHWFKTGFPVDISKVWARSSEQVFSIRDGQNNFLWKTILSPYDMLAHACLHLAFHGLGIMKNFFDVDLFLRNLPEDWDWRQYLDVVDEWNLGSVSYHVFHFCQAFFDTPVPDEIMIRTKPAWVDRILVKMLISPGLILENRMSLGRRYPSLVKFALFDGFMRKIYTIKNLLFPNRSWLKANPDYHQLWDHWAHVYQVFIRGD
jgi:hypothetical protein